MDTKEKIIATAAKVFAELGFAGVRVDALSKRIGINKATFYYHFKSKREIFETVIVRNVQELQNEIDKRLSICKTAEEKLKSFIDVMFERKRQDVLLIVREIIGGGDNLSNEVILLISSIKERLEKILQEGKKEGGFKNDDTAFVMYLILGVTDFFIMSDTFSKRFDKLQNGAFFKNVSRDEFALNLKNTVLNFVKGA